MAHPLSSSYDHLRVVGSKPDLPKAQAALYFAFRQVLSNGMRLLGLVPVERYVPVLPCLALPISLSPGCKLIAQKVYQ